MSSASMPFKNTSREPWFAKRPTSARSVEESACGFVLYAMVNMKKMARKPHLEMKRQQHWTLQQPPTPNSEHLSYELLPTSS